MLRPAASRLVIRAREETQFQVDFRPGARSLGSMKRRGDASGGPSSDVRIELTELAGQSLALVSWPLARRRARESLAPGEAAVLEGILRGLSNAAIAEERGTSVRTVANQVASLLRKFRVSSRYELAVAVTNDALPGGARDGEDEVS